MNARLIQATTLIALWLAAGPVSAQPAAIDEPSLPPPPPEVNINCGPDQYARGGEYRFDSESERWVWQNPICTARPDTWRAGCRWEPAVWTKEGRRLRLRAGYLLCPAVPMSCPDGFVLKNGRCIKLPPQRPPQPTPTPQPAPTRAPETKPVAKAGPAPILAVFDIEVVDLRLKKSFANSLADFVAMRLTEKKTYQVVPRSQLKQRLVASKKNSFKDCYDQACQIEVGKELAAEKTLATKISKMGSRCMVSLGVFDLRRATAERAATEFGKCTEDGLLKAVEDALKKLSAAP